MKARISQDKLLATCPRIFTHLVELGKVTPNGQLTAAIIHLVKLRVSQINHCCYCQHMHAEEARQDGVAQERLDVLPAWREAPCFSQGERAALAWAEALTLVADKPLLSSAFDDVVAQLGELNVVELTTVILEINSWNRVSAGFGLLPEMRTIQGA